MKNVDLKRRIVEISYKHELSHLSSCLTAVDILADIYEKKKFEDIVVLSAGHAGLAQYVLIEKYFGLDAEMLLEKHGIHPNRDIASGLYVSTGSLGHGLPIAMGIALACPDRTVYVVSSDGELREGSMYESLLILEHNYIPNIQIYVNNNGYGAYHKSRVPDMFYGWKNITVVNTDNGELPFLHGLQGHYRVMDSVDYELAMEILT